MPVTTTAIIPPAVQTYFDRKLLVRVTPFLAYEKAAQRRPMKKRSGNTMVFRRFEALALALAPIVEAVVPTGKQLSKTDISVTLQQWGDYVTVSDFGQMTVENDLLNVASDVLGEQAGQTMDALLRDVASAGTVVFYGGGDTIRTNLTGTSHKVDSNLLDRITRALLSANAKMFTELISATDRVSTFGIRPAFLAVTTPEVYFTLQELPGWISVEEYASDSKAMPGEVGAYKNIRFMISTQAKKFLGGGGTAAGDVQSTANVADVHVINVFGKDAIATVPMEGENLENIIKPLGSAGVADPLNQLATSGWKHTGARKILNDAFMARAEVTVAQLNP